MGPPLAWRTKWELLEKQRELQYKKWQATLAEMNGLAGTQCGLTCDGCGVLLETEKDFADHFLVSPRDQRMGNWNLGECPAKKVDRHG